MTYSTRQLIEILDREMRATWKGERVLLSSAERVGNPVLAKAIDLDKAGKVFAYQDFRRQIHEYQRQYRVSGIIWRVCSFGDRSVRYPEIHNQLIAIEGDKEILMDARDSVLQFWHEATRGMNFWLALDSRHPLSPDALAEFIDRSEWAEIDATRTEVYLGLCWGNPLEHQYGWAKPDSGCHRVIAAVDEPSAIKV
jgi:hypothetical protein